MDEGKGGLENMKRGGNQQIWEKTDQAGQGGMGRHGVAEARTECWATIGSKPVYQMVKSYEAVVADNLVARSPNK